MNRKKVVVHPTPEAGDPGGPLLQPADNRRPPGRALRSRPGALPRIPRECPGPTPKKARPRNGRTTSGMSPVRSETTRRTHAFSEKKPPA